ncbi:3-oxoacid CoA-transferase subunit A [Thermomicrobium sp. 4228-Ro]|uniref:CoA transferase subunit A n=1 Tax=Thermomicrobium sp. 4228-Ro TaxID=2993937 RepID=UPI002248CCD5|nr:3-oxoacid CoA-transferase subunit A [Thermomicrobium sp. 4228-Ro]MCX2727403.1 3-oxoacid CoA-transferase subunit A [Thermomicrobium sp. 4228-Ro]
MDRVVATCDEAVADIPNGASIMIGGFGPPGIPVNLVKALRRRKLRDLILIYCGGGTEEDGIGGLIADGAVRKLITSFPTHPGATAVREKYLAGELELEVLPQGTFVERIRAGGAGLGGFYTPTGVGTELTEGKEVRIIDGRPYVFELPLRADYAFIKAYRADRWGNLVYRRTMRNFNPIMATAANTVIVEVDEIVPVGALSPEEIETPCIFVDRVVEGPRDWVRRTTPEVR